MRAGVSGFRTTKKRAQGSVNTALAELHSVNERWKGDDVGSHGRVERKAGGELVIWSGNWSDRPTGCALAAPPPIGGHHIVADTGAEKGTISLDAKRRPLQARVGREL